MAEPFKNLLSQKVIEAMAKHFKSQWPEFDIVGFVAMAINDLDRLELKARTKQITNVMIKFLPDNFEEAAKIILASLGAPLTDDISTSTLDKKGISGWGVMPMADYVGLRGHDHFDLSMRLFKELTKRASAEFGIRFFIQQSPEQTLSVLKAWSRDENQHVRRLASEAIRPRLPWATRLPVFINDPSPVIDVLEQLKDDNEEYVRRSVANNLNDISKDHPDLVAKIAERWLKNASQERQRLIRHACRTLIKNGHKKTLEILGFKSPKIKPASIDLLTPTVMFGDALQFSVSISSDCNHEQALMIDYIIHHQKANGSTSPKVFKWRTAKLAANKTLTSTKKHSIRKITTRSYYPGLHRLEIVVNGVSVANSGFHLKK